MWVAWLENGCIVANNIISVEKLGKKFKLLVFKQILNLQSSHKLGTIIRGPSFLKVFDNLIIIHFE